MANTLKSKKESIPNPNRLSPDKEEQPSVKEIVQDERTHKLMGAFFLLFSIFLFVSFSSYMYTWQSDQDKVHQLGFKIFFTYNVHVQNLLGLVGAYCAHVLIYQGFGVASYLFCLLFFVIGINMLFATKVFKLFRTIKYVTVGLLLFTTAFGFYFENSQFSWGGGIGAMLSKGLSQWIGNMGMHILLFATLLAYIIWRFNPDFSIGVEKIKSIFKEPEYREAIVQTQEENILDSTEENVDEEPEINSFGNHLKKDGKLKNIAREAHETDNIPLSLLEKEENKNEESTSQRVVFIDEMVTHKNSHTKKTPPPPIENLDLQIATTTEEVVPDLVEKVKPIAAYDPTLNLKDYKYPPLDLLELHGSEKIVHDPKELEANKNQIISTLQNYDIAITQISATIGPTVTLYEIVPAAGVRISRIKNLEDDIALSLAALGIRIIAPIPGKGTIGIEVPNVKKTIVGMRTLLASDKFQNSNFSLPIALGKKIDNENFIVDLATMPHLLMAGATGQGKSVGINALLVSLLYKKHPSQLKFVLIDPKKVELSVYRTIERYFLAKLPGEDEAIITDTKKVVTTLNSLCIEMDNRYELLKEAGCRNIKEYNEKFATRKLNPEKGHKFLPFIVLVVDEFADLIMTAGKEVEMPIARLAQLARAIGIHLIIATQRPSVNIITGTIKANFPARIAFKVSSKIDSRTILDAGGAEQLIGKGDMLVSYNGAITRVQCAFVDTPEVERINNFIAYEDNCPEPFFLPEYVDESGSSKDTFDSSAKDPLFEDAARLVVQSQSGSTSNIQRKMKLGYNRAGRLMDQLESAGIVGSASGSKAREVLYTTEAELEQLLNNL